MANGSHDNYTPNVTFYVEGGHAFNDWKATGVKIYAIGSANSHIDNFGNNSTIYIGGAGKSDTVYNPANNCVIIASEGDNYIINAIYHGGNDSAYINYYYGYSETPFTPNMGGTIFTGTGKDHVSNWGTGTAINTSTGNADISNWGTDVVITSGSGTDSIHNYEEASNIKIINHMETTDHNGNYILNEAKKVTIDSNTNFAGSLYNDVSIDENEYSKALSETINNYGSEVEMYLGMGHDSVKNFAEHVTILSGAGKDDIKNFSDNVSIDAGSGDDYIFTNNNVTLKEIYDDAVAPVVEEFIQSVPYLKTASDISALFKACKRGDVEGYKKAFVSVSEDVADLVSSGEYGRLKEKVNKADRIRKLCTSIGNIEKMTKTIGEIILDSNGLLKSAANIISAWQNNAVLPLMKTVGRQIMTDFDISDKGIQIKQPSGDDLLLDQYRDPTQIIIGGTGDDVIERKYGFPMYIYREGDGNDVIIGSSPHDTLQILASSFTTSVNGNDYIFLVGNGSVTLKDRRHYVTIPNYTQYPVYVDHSSVEIGNDTNNELPDGVEIKDDKLIVSGTLTSNIDVSEQYAMDIKNIDASDAENGVEIVGNTNVESIIASNNSDTLYNISSNNFIDAGEGDNHIFNTGDSAKIKSGSGEDKVLSTGRKVSFYLGKANDIAFIKSGENTYNYSNGDGNDTVFGFGETDTINITNSIYTTVKSGDDLIVKVGTGSITLKDVSSANIIADEFVEWTFKTVGSTVTATGKINGKVVATITGLKKGVTADDLSLSGGIISIAEHALGTSNIAITGKYTLSVADDITQPIITPAGWSVSGSTAVYKSENKTAYYTLASNKKSVIYKKAVESKNLVTVKGLKSGVNTNDLTLSGKNVTVSANALGTSKVSITGGYNLVLGSDVTKSQTIAAGWNISGNTATYKTKEITAGYVLASDKKSITYNSASGGAVLTTVTGLKSSTVAKNIPINTKTKTVTLNKASLDTATVSVSGDYKLALGSDVKNKSKTTAAHFTISGTTAKYISTKITAGYSLATDKKSVSYISTTSGGGNLATITGLKKGTKATALSVSDNNVITISKAALAGKTITVSNGYTLALAKNVSAPVFTAAGWSVSGTTAKYNSEKIVAGYTLSDDKKSVNYTKSLASKNLVTVSGLVSGTTADKLSLKDNTVTLSGEIIGSKGATVNGKGYKFVLSSSGKITNVASSTSLTGSSGNDTLIGSKYADYISSGLDGSDYISGGGGNDTLLGLSGNCTLLGGNGNDYLSCDLEGNGSLVGGNGNDTLSACQGNITLAGGKGNDIFEFVLNDNKNFNATITDYTVGQNKILLDSSVSISSTHVSGNDVILNVSNSTITLKNAKGRKITFVDENGKTTSNIYSKSSSANIAELWFADEDTNFSTSFAQIDSITKNGLADYSLGNVDSIADWTALTPNDSLTSGLTYSDK